MVIVPFAAAHAKYLSDPKSEPGRLGALADSPEYFEALANSGTALSAFHDGGFVGCAGWCLYPWGTTAEVWAWMVPESSKHFLSIHRAMLRTFEHLESTVRKGNRRAYQSIPFMVP